MQSSGSGSQSRGPAAGGGSSSSNSRVAASQAVGGNVGGLEQGQFASSSSASASPLPSSSPHAHQLQLQQQQQVPDDALVPQLADELTFAADCKAETQQALMEDLMAALRKEEKLLEADAWKYTVPRSRRSDIS